MKKNVFYWLVLCVVLISACQKELSFEGSNTPAKGSLQAEITGDCLPKTVNGVYEAIKPLVADSNTITVSVNVVTTGNYVITTDTVNGYFFRGTGIFTTAGINTVKLRGNGTPFAVGTNNFVVTFDSTICDVQVVVLPAGAGGPAIFTIQNAGTPASCSGATPSGNYIIGTALNGLNTVALSVNVTKIGTYTITTTATNGMTFSKSGTFTSLGVQPLILTGSGTPTGVPGAVTIPISAGGSTCNFVITTVAGGVFTINCAGAMANGTYQAGTALSAANTITLPITVTTAGPYSISGSVNGMTFSNSGNLTLGTTSITLNGSGTPTTSTGSPFNLSVGTPACSIPITVASSGGSFDWKFTEGTTTYQGTTIVAILTTVLPPFLSLAYTGLDIPNNQIGINLIDASGTITAGEIYPTVISASNSSVFTFSLAGGTDMFSTDATRNLIFTVSSHNTTTKTIVITFIGQVKNNAGTTKTITNGMITAVY